MFFFRICINMSEFKPNQEKQYQNFTDRKLLKDLPFYRRYPRAFVVGGSTFGFLILFSKGFYDFFSAPSPEGLRKKLHAERLKQQKFQEEFE